MPKGGSHGRGGKKSHKGKRRHFTNEEELHKAEIKKEKEREWRRERGLASDSEEDSDEEKAAAKSKKPPKDPAEGSSEESSSEEEEEREEKKKGVSHLIETANPNHVVSKSKKVSQLDPTEVDKPQLSRREREELQKQQAAAHYRKMHLAGKTDEARADLARLAIIKKQREEQQKKRQEELQLKETAKDAAEKKLLDKKKSASRK